MRYKYCQPEKLQTLLGSVFLALSRVHQSFFNIKSMSNSSKRTLLEACEPLKQSSAGQIAFYKIFKTVHAFSLVDRCV